ncbi:type I restriction enzyme HsdR N-terminal domain-containing protein [Fictibacillus phosphorivorans]|uniref:type I restriction enzyme HsdR N-terminal domain-containing protein n=1 Tax=Fictibacillus phosphorivorans TaxID=1221500 RepID=UPI003CEB3783
MKVNLSLYSLSDIYVLDQTPYFLDHIRNKFIMQQPEEEIRQRMIMFLIEVMKVPISMIEVEVPLSRYSNKTSDRADIIVNYENEKNDKKPLFVVECKAEKIALIDRVFRQAERYDNILETNMYMVTNGIDLIIRLWDESKKVFMELDEIPNYIDLLYRKNLKLQPISSLVPKRIKYENNQLHYITAAIPLHEKFECLHPNSKNEFLLLQSQLVSFIWDEKITIPKKVIRGIKFIKDLGVRYTSFGNASGVDWVGYYRSFVVKDHRQKTHIISLSMHRGYLNLSIENNKVSHNSLQLNLKKFHVEGENEFFVFHDGRLTVGKQGAMKTDTVKRYAVENGLELLEPNGSKSVIYIGRLPKRKEFTWSDESVLDFVGNIIRYAIIRDELRDIQKPNL